MPESDFLPWYQSVGWVDDGVERMGTDKVMGSLGTGKEVKISNRVGFGE